jgi:PilZ domain
MTKVTHVRQALRRPYCRNLSVVYEGYGPEIPVRAPDLSVDGMFINTPRFFPEGAVLKLHFYLSRTGWEIRARAEVRYCTPGVGVGVEFVEIDEESRQAIARELEQLADVSK